YGSLVPFRGRSRGGGSAGRFPPSLERAGGDAASYGAGAGAAGAAGGAAVAAAVDAARLVAGNRRPGDHGGAAWLSARPSGGGGARRARPRAPSQRSGRLVFAGDHQEPRAIGRPRGPVHPELGEKTHGGKHDVDRAAVERLLPRRVPLPREGVGAGGAGGAAAARRRPRAG